MVLDFPDATFAKSGAIPGLVVIDDFITDAEQDDIVKNLDSHKWIKMLNRRVQHYGFEFKYGTNNVDKDESLG